jgi:hypothetical protein
MLEKGTVCAVIPTRGDVNVGVIADRLRQYLEIGEIRFVIGDTPFNRYKVMMESPAKWFYTQDDDCLTDLAPILEAYDPSVIVNAMTPEHAMLYQGRQTLIGFGALFHCGLLNCFSNYPWERDALFYRESDRIFPTVNPHETVFPKIEILPHAHNPNRLWKQPDHVPARAAMNRRIFEMTGLTA